MVRVALFCIFSGILGWRQFSLNYGNMYCCVGMLEWGMCLVVMFPILKFRVPALDIALCLLRHQWYKHWRIWVNSCICHILSTDCRLTNTSTGMLYAGRQRPPSVTHVVNIDLVFTPVSSASTSAAMEHVTFRITQSTRNITSVWVHSAWVPLTSKTAANNLVPVYFQVSDTWVIAILGKTRWEPSKKPAPNLIQFQLVIPVLIKDCLHLQLLSTNKKWI